jgi:hypothetical protein
MGLARVYSQPLFWVASGKRTLRERIRRDVLLSLLERVSRQTGRRYIQPGQYPEDRMGFDSAHSKGHTIEGRVTSRRTNSEAIR